MAGYRLQPNESFVHQSDRVHHGGLLAVFANELILTNRNIVLVKKGVFGNSKGIQVFPLHQVKTSQGKAQAVVGKHPAFSTLDVYFQNGTEQFVFESKKEATFWSQKINEVITGTPARMTDPDPSQTEVLVEQFMGVFGLKSGAEATAEPPPVAAGDCVSCGAPISGVRGQTTVCGYCDTPNQL